MAEGVKKPNNRQSISNCKFPLAGVLFGIAVGQCLLHFIYFKEFINYWFCFFKV